MLHLDHKYLNLLSTRLKLFKRKSPNLYNFRCPFCNDSQTNERKARGYVYNKGTHLSFFCHNCNESMWVSTLVKRLDARLHAEYQFERLKDVKDNLPAPEAEEDQNTYDSVAGLASLGRYKTIKQLQDMAPARKYFLERLLPSRYEDEFRWVPKFMEWTNSLIPGKFDKEALNLEHGRMVIPFFNRTNRFIGYQGRVIDNRTPRYISISLDKNEPMLYGIERVNLGKDIFVFEGPLDSCFVTNAISIAGCNFASLTKALPYNRLVMCYDNEPHSKDTRRKIKEAIEQGVRVVIWPDGIAWKDVNKMIMEGYSAAHVEYILNNNIYEGMFAKAKLVTWGQV